MVDGRWTGRRKGIWGAGEEKPQLGGDEVLFGCAEVVKDVSEVGRSQK